MSIQSYSGIKNILTNHAADSWKSKIDFNSELEMPLNKQVPLDELNSSEKIKTFGDYLGEQLVKVNGLQQEANVMMEQLASGESSDLQGTLLAVERADMAFKTMNQVRMKVIDAYREIMKMQV